MKSLMATLARWFHAGVVVVAVLFPLAVGTAGATGQVDGPAQVDPSKPTRTDEVIPKSPVEQIIPHKQPIVRKPSEIEAMVEGPVLQNWSGGKIDRAGVEKTLRVRVAAMDMCLEKAARKNLDVGGELVLRVTVTQDGRASAMVLEDHAQEERLTHCVQRKLSQWRYPRPEGEAASFDVRFTFRLVSNPVPGEE